MEEKAFDIIDNCEDWHWWHKARKEIITDIILNNIKEYENKKLLDIGCGSGFFLNSISNYIKDSTGIESHNYNNSKYNNILKVDIFNNGLKDSTFDIITSLDVLEHMEDEKKFIDEIKRLLNKDNGYLVLTVPAYQFLFSYHDEINNHYRRYNKTQLKKLLINNGFAINKITYFNFFLFPPFFMVRLIHKIFNIKSSEEEKKSIFNNILYKIFRFEKYLLRKINFPFGSSLLVICKLK